MKFSKEDTLFMKGLAILIMFFHHSFLGPDRWMNLPITFFPFEKEAVVYLAGFFKICVGMFVFLTGYGMMASASKKIKTKLDMKKYLINRYTSLMSGFVFIFIAVQVLAIPTGYFQEIYGKGALSVCYFFIDAIGLSHLLGTPVFCPTWWYMSLATILIIVFPIFVRMLREYDILVLFISFLLPFALKLPMTDFIRWMPCYFLGMYCAEYDILAKIKNGYNNQKSGKKLMLFALAAIGLLGIIKLRQHPFIGAKFINIWDCLAPAFVILISYLFLVNFKGLKQLLVFFGKHSMNMFLIHTLFRGMFFQKFIYSFYYARLDYAVLLAVSLVSSLLIELLKRIVRFDKVINKMKSRLYLKLGMN